MTTKEIRSAANTRRCRVLIVDDHPILRHGLAELISRQPDMEVCGQAADASEALAQFEASRPDLAIIDISLDGENGIELIEYIRDTNSGVKVLVSSMHEEKIFAGRCIRAGATGYVGKTEPVDKVLEAVRCVARGEIFLSPDVEKRLLQLSSIGAPIDGDPVESLTNRELEVFEMIGHGLTTRKISRKLGLSPRTIETHRVKIKTKLHLVNSAELNHCAFMWVSDQKLS